MNKQEQYEQYATQVERAHDRACAKHNKLTRQRREVHRANSPHAVKNRSK